MMLQIYQSSGRRMIHPAGTGLCEAFHHIGSFCICECWTPDGEAEWPDGWYLNETGETLTNGVEYFGIFEVKDL